MLSADRCAIAVISAGRLLAYLNDVNRFGATPTGGAERLAWTDPEMSARRWLMHRCEELGLNVDQDEAGNVWASPSTSSAVFLGSHLDTVPNGGQLDGSLGIVSALEVVRAAVESEAPGAERLGLVCFTDEEGVRFGIGMTGSRAVAGNLDHEELEDAVASDGTRLTDVLVQAGIDPRDVGRAESRRERMSAYLELHIEQGRQLERMDIPVGIVTSIVGLSNMRIEIEGAPNHAGTTLPDDRQDALVPVAEIVLAAQRGMRTRPDVVATVGDACVIGGASNVIPGRARCSLDVRSTDRSVIDEVLAEVMTVADGAAADNGCTLNSEEVKRLEPVEMHGGAIDAIERAARREGISARRVPSMAGHDAMNLARSGIPCGMVFVRSARGVSHSPHEMSTEADCIAAARVLAGAALALARETS